MRHADQDDRLVDEYVRYHFRVEPPQAPAAGQDESVVQAPVRRHRTRTSSSLRTCGRTSRVAISQLGPNDEQVMEKDDA